FLAERVRSDPGREGDRPIAVDRKQHDRRAVDDRPRRGLAFAELALHLEALLQFVSNPALLAVVLSVARRSRARSAAARRPAEEPTKDRLDAGPVGFHPGITRGRGSPGYGSVTVGRRPGPLPRTP